MLLRNMCCPKGHKIDYELVKFNKLLQTNNHDNYRGEVRLGFNTIILRVTIENVSLDRERLKGKVQRTRK